MALHTYQNIDRNGNLNIAEADTRANQISVGTSLASISSVNSADHSTTTMLGYTGLGLNVTQHPFPALNIQTPTTICGSITCADPSISATVIIAESVIITGIIGPGITMDIKPNKVLTLKPAAQVGEMALHDIKFDPEAALVCTQDFYDRSHNENPLLSYTTLENGMVEVKNIGESSQALHIE